MIEEKKNLKNKYQVVPLLISLSILLVITSSIVGISLDDGGKLYLYTTIRGSEVEIYGGAGIYRYDDYTKAVTMRGFDWANLFVCVPLFVTGWFLHRKNSLKGIFLLLGNFLYLAYSYLIGVMGNAYNGLYLVWTLMYSVGIFGLIFLLREGRLGDLITNIKKDFPVRSLAVYMFSMGILLPTLYLMEIINGWSLSVAPVSLSHYTTLELAGLEIGLMVPLHFIGGILLLLRNRTGYIISITLVCTTLIMFISLTSAQVIMYLEYSQDFIIEIVRMGFFALVGLVFTVLSLRKISEKCLY